MMQDFPSAELKTASSPEVQELYSDAVKNFKKLHSPTLKLYQKLKESFYWITAISAIYLILNYDDQKPLIVLLFLLLFIFMEIERIYLWLYVQKIKQQYTEQYLKTFGKITQVSNYNSYLKYLNIELEFYDLAKQVHQKTFTIRYPEFTSLEYIEVKPEQLVGQMIEVCLTPDCALLLQIRTFHHNPDELPILTHQLHKHLLWQRHKNHLLHPSYFYPESIQSIHFIRKEYAGDFQLICHGLNQEFYVSSSSPSLAQIEKYLFALYSDFFMKHDGLQPAESEYRKFKFSNKPIHVELWKNPTTPIPNKDI